MPDAVDIFLGEVKCQLQRFKPQPGDVFVLTIPEEISDVLHERMTSDWSKHLPHKILVISGDAKLELKRPNS